ncbi:MAG: M23 family metallopeptidase, partial [Alphaproteobacteria bacterium]|nr:M23 family metallopeptidase [Alphaproteobacteria bacterium]
MQRSRHAALLKAAGYEDAPALDPNATEGSMPAGRELSLSWLAGVVMTGLTSVLLMGGGLYVSFLGQDTFSTAVDALPARASLSSGETSLVEKTRRIKPVALTRSELETVEAAIREEVEGRSIVRKQPFSRLKATLATSATALTESIPAYDPVALLNSARPATVTDTALVSTEIYGANVEGELEVRNEPLSLADVPAKRMSDNRAKEFARQAIVDLYGESGEAAYLAYASADVSFRDLGVVGQDNLPGVVENMTIVPKTTAADQEGIGRSERIVTIKQAEPLRDALTRNGFTPAMIDAIAMTLQNVYPRTDLPLGARLRILFGPSRIADTVIPYRLSIYVSDAHVATVALTDRGRYVLATKPADIVFPDEDTEEVNVNNLPTIYRSIWETGRKHGMPDRTIEQIITLYAYDLDLSRRIEAGDSIELLQTEPDAGGDQDLLYVALSIGKTKREFFRFLSPEGGVDFFDADGQTGKRFLTRRPLEGGGTRIASRFGYRKHPIFGTYKLHTGVDLSAPYRTPIYASGDGVVERAQWVSGYGRYVELRHVNGYETGYGHMSSIADGIAPGVHVRQGQIIGYVG